MLSEYFNPGEKPKVGVLINPLSGGNQKGLGRVRQVIGECPRVQHHDARTPAEMMDALTHFARQGVNLLAVNGGDGTVQAVLTHIFGHEPFQTMPLLAVLQSGTTSMTARDVGFSGSRARSLQRLFRWAVKGEGQPQLNQRPVLRVQAPGHPARCGMFFGTAAIYQGIQYFHRNVNSRGLRGEVGPGLTILRFLWAAVNRHRNFLAADPITVALDGKPPRRFDSLVVLISTLERLFLGIYPYWGPESGPLHYTALRAQPHKLFAALPSILRGRAGRHARAKNGFYSHNVNEVKLNLGSGFTLDGQLYTPEAGMKPTVVSNAGTASFLRIL